MKKFLVIIPAVKEALPYIDTYTSILDKYNISYNVIYWNRHGEVCKYGSNYIAYEKKTNDEYSAPRKIYDIYKFYRFVLKHLKKVSYDGIFIYTIADSIFFFKYLRKYYKNRYVFDIRDYSPIIQFNFFRYALTQVLNNSYINIISSEGFKSFLPNNIPYIITHNTSFREIKINSDKYDIFKPSEPYNILTIGRLRDENANIEIVNQLGNRDNIHLSFVGSGPSEGPIKNHVNNNKIKNVEFYGWYEKSAEDDHVLRSHMINVCMEDNLLSRYLLSNRLYLAARLKRPLLSFNDCYQATIIKKFNLGLIVSREDDIYEKIMDFWNTFDFQQFNQGCENFLSVVKNDLLFFEEKILDYIEK